MKICVVKNKERNLEKETNELLVNWAFGIKDIL
jgi:hypothetical protein